MMVTVFTPSYNRCNLLPRLYQSMAAQKCDDFEWVIVDDGSDDDTERVVSKMIKEDRVRIQYIKQKNGGKHAAHNTALKVASGELFICVDSDDYLAEDAIAHIVSCMDTLQEKDCAFVMHKATKDGQLLGNCFPRIIDKSVGMYELCRQGAGGEYAFVFKTELIRRYSYPEISGERFVGESVLYDRLELDGYSVKPIDVVLEVCEYQADGLSSGAYRLLLDNPTGYQIYHSQRIDLVDTVMEKLRHGICYWAFRILSGNKEYTYRGRHRWLNAVTVLPGIAAAYYYKIRGKFQR